MSAAKRAIREKSGVRPKPGMRQRIERQNRLPDGSKRKIGLQEDRLNGGGGCKGFYAYRVHIE